MIALAVLGVTSKGFHRPETYMTQLSAILKISRFFVLRLSYFTENSFDDSNSDSNSSISLDLGLESEGPIARLISMVNRFMIRGSHSPMDWLLTLRAYGMNISRNTTSIGQIDWRGDYISYGGLVGFFLSDFRGFIHGLITSTRTILLQDILFANISTQSIY